MNEINTVCDLCNCYWGPPGNRTCDIELTRKFCRPRIPPQCPHGHQPTLKGMPEFVKRVEESLIAKLVLNHKMTPWEMEREIGIHSEKLGRVALHLERKGVLKKVRNRGECAKWAINRSWKGVTESRGEGS